MPDDVDERNKNVRDPPLIRESEFLLVLPRSLRHDAALMSHALSFSPEFFSGEVDSPQRSDRPTSVRQAIASLSEEAWRELAAAVFDVRPQELSPDAVLARVLATNTCTSFNEPVEVWIDRQGGYTLHVYSPD